jgi:ClpX C4-type zinc finger
MYYKVFVDGTEIGTFGHPSLESIHLSVSGGVDGMYFFASAVCTEDNKRVFLDWVQRDLRPTDIVEIRSTPDGAVPEPRKRFVMGRPTREPSPESICDFCQRKETEVSRLVHIDEHRPSICADCVGLCNEILRSPA